jgi:hypothetical protein
MTVLLALHCTALPLYRCTPVLQTYNYGKDSYDIGEGFGHFGIAAPDVAKLVESVKAKGERSGGVRGIVRARARSYQGAG